MLHCRQIPHWCIDKDSSFSFIKVFKLVDENILFYTGSIFRIRLRSASFNVLIVDESMGDELSSLSASCKNRPGAQDQKPLNDAFRFPEVTGSRRILQRL